MVCICISAPEMGPDFWRILQEDPARNVTNVTLIFKVGKDLLDWLILGANLT